MKFGRAIDYIWNAKKGFCAICGKSTLFVVTDTPETIRNHAVCIRCRSTSRNRHVAKYILDEFKDRGIARLSDFKRRPEISVFNTSSSGHVAKALGKAPNIFCSEFFDDVEPGGYRDGVLNQDLQRLTFSDNSIDLIISEDVFEHVPDYRQGFRETWRVLKPGSLHVFSIPFYFDRRTRDLFDIVDGKRILREPIEYHGDPVRGEIPCFTHFGYDTLDLLSELGFAARVEISRYVDNLLYGTFDSYTFIAKKK